MINISKMLEPLLEGIRIAFTFEVFVLPGDIEITTWEIAALAAILGAGILLFRKH